MTQTTENTILTIENDVFHSKEGFVSGTPIFVGTRVPIKLDFIQRRMAATRLPS